MARERETQGPGGEPEDGGGVADGVPHAIGHEMADAADAADGAYGADAVVDREPLAALDALLDFLKRNRGFDFTGYKRSTLTRRIQKRMQAVGVERYADYVEYLEVQPDEFGLLFNTILINVTGFFRDGQPWEVLRSELVPQIVARKQPGDSIRVWSAGCSSGEEAYTLAMVLAEALGAEEFRARAKIYATDVDDEALAHARSATYASREVAEVPTPLLEKYFERGDGRYTFRKDLRRSVIFGRNDLLNDAPISRIDLLVCRNTLMYFTAATQAKILARLHFALTEGGYLMLGRAETLLTHGNTFVPVDLRRRIFTKVARPYMRYRIMAMSQLASAEASAHASAFARLRDAAFDAGQPAQLAFDRNGVLALVNERARILFGIAASDLGRLLQDLELSYRPIELRSLIAQVSADRRPMTVHQVAFHAVSGDSRWFDVHVTPLSDGTSVLLGVSVAFVDVTGVTRLQKQLEQTHQELEAAYEELQSTNEELQTTNEELQSTVEELETTNEELQSTNEELETINEELQSSNEELHTINEEVVQRSDELNDATALLESVLGNLGVGIAVLDANLNVVVWNRVAEDMWGLRSEEAEGTNFFNLDIGLPVEPLRAAIRRCLTGEERQQVLVLPAVNRRGKHIQCRTTVNLPTQRTGDRRGVILLMEDASSQPSQ